MEINKITVRCSSCGFGVSGVVKDDETWITPCSRCKKIHIRKGYEKGYAHREVVEEDKEEGEKVEETKKCWVCNFIYVLKDQRYGICSFCLSDIRDKIKEERQEFLANEVSRFNEIANQMKKEKEETDNVNTAKC